MDWGANFDVYFNYFCLLVVLISLWVGLKREHNK